MFDFSVIRLIQQYLKESNLVKTLQTLQVLIYIIIFIYIFILMNSYYESTFLMN